MGAQTLKASGKQIASQVTRATGKASNKAVAKPKRTARKPLTRKDVKEVVERRRIAATFNVAAFQATMPTTAAATAEDWTKAS